MNLKFQLLNAFFLSFLCGIGFIIVAYLVGDHLTSGFDLAVISAVQGLENPVWTDIMRFFTIIGDTPAVAVISIVVLFILFKVLHHRTELILFVAVIGGQLVLNQLLKLYFHRPRPTFHRLAEASGYSFPSGHSMSAFALYGILAFLLWRHVSNRFGRGMLIAASIVMTVAIGISRIYLGVHYPSDVVGGYLASGFWLVLAIWFYQRYQEKGNS